jgi:hypothetical protein
MKRISIAGFLALAFMLTSAAQAASIQASIVDYDDLGDGFGVYGSTDRLGLFRFFGAYDSVDHLDRLSLGAGIAIEFLPLVDFEAGVSYQRWDFTSADIDTNAYSVYGSVAFTAAPMFRLIGRVEYLDLDDGGDDTIIGLGARIGLNRGPSGMVMYERYTDTEFNVVRAGLRWGF